MKEFDRFSFPRNYSGKVPLFFRKFPEKFRRKFPEISELTTLVTIFDMVTCIAEEKSVCSQLQPLLKGMELCGAILTTLHLMPPNLM